MAKSDKYKKQDEDMKERKPVYIAYDDNGLLVVKELNDMITDVLIDATQVGDYSYTSSIEDTFTQILVVREANVMKDGKKTKEFLRTGSAAAKKEIAKLNQMIKKLMLLNLLKTN